MICTKPTWDSLTNAQSPAQFFSNQDPRANAGDVIHDYAEWCTREFDVTRADAMRALCAELDAVPGWREMTCAAISAHVMRSGECPVRQ